MNILIAPNSMKGSLAATDFATAVEKAFAETCPGFFQTRCVPIADGGDGTADVLIQSLKMETRSMEVRDPLGRTIKAEFGYKNNTAVIEMASASGMWLLEKSELNPLKTSSYGTGELIGEAARLGAKTIFLGVGGSATVDGGMGMLEAQGFRFYDDEGNPLQGNGENMLLIDRIEPPDRNELKNIGIKIISDVDNPLLGPNGAALVFAPQKGATPEMVKRLDEGLKNIEQKIAELTGTSAADLKGSGAAGGIAIGLVVFFGAEIVPGAEFILSLLNFEKHLEWADVVITGEGKFDSQSLRNKAPWVVAQKAKEKGKPVYAIVGVNEFVGHQIFIRILQLKEPDLPINYLMEHAEEFIYRQAVLLANTLIRE